ncbi:MAG TPA: hypothetical protein VK208_12635 [Pyrinomonadaceae bacterium]|jgi:hypothetical protein|nr:hypothetical protein [Pyrinomonadaceae bacterium]
MPTPGENKESTQSSRYSVAKLGEKVDMKKAITSPPAVVLAVQPTAYFRIDKPEELEAFEKDAQRFLGIRNLRRIGVGSESCSCGCSDDCDMLEA